MTGEKEKVNGDAAKVTPVEECSRKHGARGTWSNQLDFFLSCLGYAVGLGNIWRFPFLCFKYGGGAFLIPYLITLILCGLPLFYLELSLGQYSGVGPNILFKRLGPAFRGIGYGMVIVSFLVVLYYNVIIAWTLFYTFASFTSKLGWETCGNEWNTPACFNDEQNIKCLQKNLTYWNNTCYDPAMYCNSIPGFLEANATHCFNTTAAEVNSSELYVVTQKATKRIWPSEEYYSNYVLGATNSFGDFGKLRWQLALCLLLAWILVCVCLIKGVKSSGKVVYFTALFPYVVLFIFLVRGALLEGAADGVFYYIVPKWKELKDPKVWVTAATQIFYSLGIGFGALPTLASYNSYRNNCYRDAIVIAISNCATSIFAGFVIFSILGFMAHSLDVPVDEVVRTGPGLAFIVYPGAVARLPVSPLWAFLFFFMVITLGMDSQFTMCETVITAILDEWPSLRRVKSTVVVVTSVILFLLGLPMCYEGGIYIFTLLDDYSASVSLLVISAAECLVIGWNYGIKRYARNVEEMIGKKPNLYWRFCWCILSPLLMLAILVFTLVKSKPSSYGDYHFPPLATALGAGMALLSIIVIPLFAVYEIYKAKKKGKPLRDLFRATEEWENQNKNEEKATPLQIIAPNIFKQLEPDRETYDNPSFQYSAASEKVERL